MVYTLTPHPVGGHFPMVGWGSGDFPPTPAVNPVNDGAPGWSGGTGGVPVDGSALPKRINWDEPADNPPPDFDGMPILNVSAKAKETIEAVEPDIHQFFPVEYFGRDSSKIETRYWFVICNRLDSIHPLKSNMVLNPMGWWSPPKDAVRRKWAMPPHVTPDLPPKFVIDRSKVGDFHFWREKRTSSGLVLMSAHAWRAIELEKLTGLRPEQVEAG